MIFLDYNKKNHNQIINVCVKALKQGKVVAYPTDTSYGLAVDATNVKAIKKLYKVKGRDFKKPIHIIPPSLAYAKRIVKWNKTASKLAKKFWPGPLTLVLGLKASAYEKKGFKLLSVNNGWLGLRMPKNKIALDLAKYLKRPITTTSANISDKPDCYSTNDIISQFKNNKFKPDIIINFGKLAKRKPSTIVKINPSQPALMQRGGEKSPTFFQKRGSGGVLILRQGPISKKQILKIVQ